MYYKVIEQITHHRTKSLVSLACRIIWLDAHRMNSCFLDQNCFINKDLTLAGASLSLKTLIANKYHFPYDYKKVNHYTLLPGSQW